MQVKVNITLSIIAQERLKVERRKGEKEEGKKSVDLSPGGRAESLCLTGAVESG